MSILDKMKNTMGLGGDTDEIMEEELEEKEPARPITPPPLRQDNVIDISDIANSPSKDLARRMNVIIVLPKSFDDAQEIANSLKSKKPVVVNFEGTESETAKRIIDFVSGTTYALGGVIKKLGRSVFLCAPSNVNVSDGGKKAENEDYSWTKK